MTRTAPFDHWLRDFQYALLADIGLTPETERRIAEASDAYHTTFLRVISEGRYLPEEQIRPDVVIAVRFALASLPEQSRMLDTVPLPRGAPSARYDGIPWRSRPVVVPAWDQVYT